MLYLYIYNNSVSYLLLSFFFLEEKTEAEKELNALIHEVSSRHIWSV